MLSDAPLHEPPLVTVVVPAFNAEATLARTLRSIADQTHRRLEILIVDDGSTDGTAAIAAEFCAGEPRARLIRQENKGVAAARNRGLSEAASAWIAPIDADDLWHPRKIELQLAAALAAPSPPGFVYCWSRLIDEGDRVIGTGEAWEVHGPALTRLLYRNFVGNGSALLLSKTAALEAGGYDESLRGCGAQGCEDIALQLAVARRHPVAAVPQFLVGYRLHGQVMSGDADRMFRSWQHVVGRLRADGANLPPQVLRRNLAFRTLQLAEARALRGNRRGSAAALWQALRLDFTRTTAQLSYRALRLAARLLRGRRPAPPQPLFADLDPTQPVPGDPDALPRLARLLHSIDARRMAGLGRA